MTEQLLIAILYSRGLIQNIKIEYVKQSRPRGDDDVFCGTCCRISASPYFDVVSDRFRCSEISYTDLKIKNLNNCFLKDITKLYFATKIFSLPDDKYLRNCIVANRLLF